MMEKQVNRTTNIFKYLHILCHYDGENVDEKNKENEYKDQNTRDENTREEKFNFDL